jgi:hypothetical protein
MPGSRKHLFFLHIPKTAGTSVRKMLEVRVGLKNTVLLLTGADFRTVRPRLKETELVAGHLWFMFKDQLANDCFIITFLRDPLERAISSFHYFKTLSPSELQQHLGTQSDDLWISLRSDDIATFIEQHYEFALRELGERQTADLSRQTSLEGIDCLSDLPLKVDDDALIKAKTNLELCQFVGITERFDDSMALLAFEMGWDLDAEILEANKSKRPALAELDARTKGLLSKICARDIELYKHGQRLFNQRWRKALALMLEQNRCELARSHSVVLPSAVQFSFDDGIRERVGFHEPEYVNGRWVAWTGPESKSGLLFDLDSRPGLTISVKVAATYDVETFEQLLFFVDGKPVPSFMKEVLTHEVVIPAGFCTNSDRLRLEVQSKIVCPAELSPEHSDTRKVGAALESVTIEPHSPIVRGQ